MLEFIAESPVNIRLSVLIALGKVKMPTASEALLVALRVNSCVWHTFKVYVEPGVVEVKEFGRN